MTHYSKNVKYTCHTVMYTFLNRLAPRHPLRFDGQPAADRSDETASTENSNAKPASIPETTVRGPWSDGLCYARFSFLIAKLNGAGADRTPRQTRHDTRENL